MRQQLALLLVAALLPACATTRGGRRDVYAHPLGSGSVEFVGFDPQEVEEDFRIIPEEGLALVPAVAGTRIEKVDGFWWRGSRQWFKIPDHCHARVHKSADGIRSTPECSEFGKRVQRLRGGIAEPQWVDDSGPTQHATGYPF